MRAFVAVSIPAFGALAVLGSASILSGRPGIVDFLLVGFIVVVLGGLLVLGGSAVLARELRGIPDVRIDPEGIVWGRDRGRDQSVDWRAIERVITRVVNSGTTSERAFIIRPLPGRADHPAKTRYGRFMAVGNRLRYGTPYVISTYGMDHTWEEIRAALGAHLRETPFDLEEPRRRS